MKKKKILIIAISSSSHTHAWVDLIDKQKFEVRLFGIENSRPAKNILRSFYYAFRENYPFINQKANQSSWLKTARKILFIWDQRQNYYLEKHWLTRIIKKWKPDIIHTLGLNPGSYYYLICKNKYYLNQGQWVVTARGGPDLALNYLVEEERNKIKTVLQKCDYFIADNLENYRIAKKLGINQNKIASFGIAPGSGGIDIKKIKKYRHEPASKLHLILWPKAYECPASKALPVLEAIKLAWPKIQPCQIIMTAVTEEVKLWFETLPEEIKKSCQLFDRIERQKLLQIMGRSRIILAPSLIDGIPNVLYEAMAIGALPIFSPLTAIKEIANDKNILFARNLYPLEIAKALILGMQNDKLVDEIVKNNIPLVYKVANRETITQKVNDFYWQIIK